MSKKLIIIRHGESIWNNKKIYTGWANIPLTEKGIKQMKHTGLLLKKNNIIPSIAYHSMQRRSIDSNNILIDNMNININSIASWRLNERHYGILTGHSKNKINWKGSYFDIPNTTELKKINVNMNESNVYNPFFGESYYMTEIRLIPILNEIKLKLLTENHNILICAHKNILRVLIRNIENINMEHVNHIHIPNATPIIYSFDNNMNIIKKNIII